MDIKQYERLKYVCCRAWKIPPWEFDKHASQGGIYFKDLYETYILESSTPIIGENIKQYVFREQIKEQSDKAQRIKQLSLQIKYAANEIDKEKWQKELDAINNG